MVNNNQSKIIETLESIQIQYKNMVNQQQQHYDKIIECLDNLQHHISAILMPAEPEVSIIYPRLDIENAHDNAKKFALEVIKYSNKKDEVIALINKYAAKVNDIPLDKLEEFCDSLFSIELPKGVCILKNGCPF